MLKLLEKMLSRWGQLIYVLALLAVIVTSARLYSAWFTPVLNSDNAVHILMAQDFRFPEDLYYWGQDRRGSFEPALVSLILQGFSSLNGSTSPILLSSIIQFFLIALAFYCFSQFLRHRLSKFIFALIWFLPPLWFHDLLLLAQPYYAQLAFLGVGFCGISTLEKKTTCPSQPKEIPLRLSIGLVSLVVISLFCSLWISELSAFLLIGLCGHIGFFYISSSRKQVTAISKRHLFSSLQRLQERRYWASFITISGWAAVCTWLLSYAKSHATAIGDYQVMFATGDEILINLSRIAIRLWPIVTFQDGSFFLSFSLLGLLFFLSSLLHFVWNIDVKNDWIEVLSTWKVFFLGSSCILFLFLLCSKWVFLNATASRYFTLPFIFGILGLLMALEALPRFYNKRASSVLLLLAFFSAFSFPAHLGSVYGTVPSREQLAEFRDLPNSAFIGDYWTSYVICAVAPNVLSCTPHEESVVRCLDCVDEVFSKDRAQIYLVKNSWFDDFPDMISQFERKLMRSGPPRDIGGYVLAPYRLVNLANDVRTP